MPDSLPDTDATSAFIAADSGKGTLPGPSENSIEKLDAPSGNESAASSRASSLGPPPASDDFEAEGKPDIPRDRKSAASSRASSLGPPPPSDDYEAEGQPDPSEEGKSAASSRAPSGSPPLKSSRPKTSNRVYARRPPESELKIIQRVLDGKLPTHRLPKLPPPDTRQWELTLNWLIRNWRGHTDRDKITTSLKNAYDAQQKT